MSMVESRQSSRCLSNLEVPTSLELCLLALVPLIHRSQVTYDARIHFRFGLAMRTLLLPARQIPVVGADAEDRGDREVGQVVVGADLAHEALDGLRIGCCLAQVDVQYGASGVFGLEVVLEFEDLPDVVGVVDRQLGRVGIEGRFRCLGGAGVGTGDLRVPPTVELGEPVGGPLGRRRLEVVHVARLFLKLHEALSQNLQRMVKGFREKTLG